MHYLYNSSQPFDAVILAAGEFPKHPIPLAALIRFRERIICCDSAADALLEAKLKPMAVVGDGDSISPVARNLFSDRLHLNPEQDTNDLTKAFNYAISQGFSKILILGATGKREDHTLANISLLADYATQANIEMLTDHGQFSAINGHAIMETELYQQISFFCMDSSPLTIRGVKWPLNKATILCWWQATLNEARGQSIEIESTGSVVVFRAYK